MPAHLAFVATFPGAARDGIQVLRPQPMRDGRLECSHFRRNDHKAKQSQGKSPVEATSLSGVCNLLLPGDPVGRAGHGPRFWMGVAGGHHASGAGGWASFRGGRPCREVSPPPKGCSAVGNREAASKPRGARSSCVSSSCRAHRHVRSALVSGPLPLPVPVSVTWASRFLCINTRTL